MGKYPCKTIDGKKDKIHRHIMAEQLGRPLESHEHVYHINGNPLDNRNENLVIIIKKSTNKRNTHRGISNSFLKFNLKVRNSTK